MNEQRTNSPVNPNPDANPDLITGTTGSHPVGTGLGAIGAGAAAGAAGGIIAGPIGAVAGAAIGAVVGGLAGKAAAEAVNPTIETKFWLESYSTRPYSKNGFQYEEYAPAYRYGWESYGRHGGKGQKFESIEADLGRGWDQAKGSSRLAWDQAREASRDAWNRVQNGARSPD